MKSSFEQTLVEVWRQVLIENTRAVELGGSGKRVMQFLREGRYVAVVVAGKVNLYGRGE